MSITNYQEIKRHKILKGVCSVCSKKRTRTLKESQTINPFNKNTDGTIKTYLEVKQSVEDKLSERVDRFLKEGFVCRSCKEFLGY